MEREAKAATAPPLNWEELTAGQQKQFSQLVAGLLNQYLAGQKGAQGKRKEEEGDEQPTTHQ